MWRRPSLSWSCNKHNNTTLSEYRRQLLSVRSQRLVCSLWVKRLRLAKFEIRTADPIIVGCEVASLCEQPPTFRRLLLPSSSSSKVKQSPLFLGTPWPWSGPGSVVGVATGYGLDGPGIESRWERDFPPGPGARSSSCGMGTRSFPGAKSGQGVTLTPHPLLVPWSRKSRAIPLLPLWAVRPCTGTVHFTFYFDPEDEGTYVCRNFVSRCCIQGRSFTAQ